MSRRITQESSLTWGGLWALLCMLAAPVALYLAIVPRYRLWSREMRGKAALAEAEWDRKIATLEAQAKGESAKSLAIAEVERAKGVAEANRIIGQSLADNEGYLRYLWIQGLQAAGSQVIYVPTEANLPILEASRGGAK